MTSSVLVLVLGITRVSAIVFSQVLWRTACGPTWLPISLLMGIVLAPVVVPTRVWDVTAAFVYLEPEATWQTGTILAELVLGTALGLAASLPGYALLGAAHQTLTLFGTVVGRGYTHACVVAALAMGMSMGMHRPLLAALVGSFSIWPAGHPELWSVFDAPQHIALGVHTLALLALAFATPVLLVMLVVDLAMGALAGGPASWVEVARPAMRLGLALIALAAAWESYPSDWSRALGPLELP